jgi:hypothetical protein
VAKKVTKPAAKKPTVHKAEAAKTKGAAPAKAAAPASEPAADQPAKPKVPALPPRPVPPHQQFLNKGVKPQHMNKARIIRHQGR